MILGEPKAGSLILIVDDNPTDRKILERTVSNMGYQVLMATNGREALDIIQSESNFSLLITDISMPGLDGIDLLKQTTYTHPRLPVIVVSGVEDEKTETLLSQLGITRHLVKPIKKDALQDLIDQTMDHHDYDDGLIDHIRELVIKISAHKDPGLKVDASEPAFLRFSSDLLGEICSVVSLYGMDLGATLVLGTGMPWWSRIATGYLDGAQAPNSTILYDCAGEFANEFATRLRDYFRSKGITSRQSPQLVFRTKRVELMNRATRPSLVVPFTARGLTKKFFVELSITHRGLDVETEVELQESGSIKTL